MASKRVSTREELRGMKRADLQKLAKNHHIKANLKTDALIDELVQARAAQASPRPGPSAIRKERSGATLILDEQENNKPEPTPKLTDSSMSSSGHGSPARPHKPKDPQRVKPGPGAGTARPKLPGAGGDPTKKVVTVKKAIIPPGVVAAHPDVKGKGKARVPSYAAPIRTVSGTSKPPIVKPLPKADTKDQKMDVVPTTRLVPSVSDLTPPLRPASHSGPSPFAALNSNIEKLEHAREASRERREAELEVLRNQLKSAQDSINTLAEQNDDLRARLNAMPAAATQKDMNAVLARLSRLEEQFSKMDVDSSSGGNVTKRPLSASSSEADLGAIYEPLPPMRSEFQTPPNRFDRNGRTSRVLAPAVRIDNRVEAPRTPPPHLRRYSTNPDESPSPTRQPSTTGRIVARPPPTSVPTARHSTAFMGRPIRRASSVIEDSEALVRASKRVPDSSKRPQPIASRMLESHDESGAETDPEDRRQPEGHVEDSAEEDSPDVPLTTLPYSLVAAPVFSTPPAHGTTETPGSRSQMPRRGRSGRGSARPHPYVRPGTPRNRGDEEESPSGPRNLRDIFGPTPGPSYAGSLPFADGTIPALKLGRPSNASTYADLETPLPSPARPQPTEETPPAARTRFGTEFSSTMKTRFSD